MLDKRPLRYGLVGLLCAVTHNLIVIGGHDFGIHYVVSTLMSYVVVVLLGYFLHTFFTFSQPLSLVAFGRYSGAMVMNYPLSVMTMFLLVDIAKLGYPLASPISTVMLMGWNYFASRWAIAAKVRSISQVRTHDS